MSSLIPGIRFHPTDAELINILKRFLKGETLQCPIKFEEIYGDKPPWLIFGLAEEKTGYFITPLKKLKQSNKRYARTCADGTWRGETRGNPVKDHKGSVVGFRRNYKYHSPTTCQENNSSAINWLMREYVVGDDFFSENNIPKQDFAVCRIKKYIKQKKVKDVPVTCDMEEDVAEGVIQELLYGPDCTTHLSKVIEEADQWESIIDELCDEKSYEFKNKTRQFNQMNDHETAMEIQNTTSSTILEDEDAAYGQIEQLQSQGADDIIGNNEFWESISRILEDVTVDIPDNYNFCLNIMSGC